MKKIITLAAVIALLLFGKNAQAGLISETDIISDWSATTSLVVNSSSARWGLSNNTISNGGNRNGSLVSDFVSVGDFTFSASIRPSGDNDYVGLVFGWQDNNNAYGFGWGGGGVGSLNGISLFKEVAGVRTRLVSNTLSWTSNVTYDFTVGRSGNDIFARISQAGAMLFSVNLADQAFTQGNVGFDSYSQTVSFNNVNYITSSTSEPASFLIFALGLAGLGFVRRKNQA